jgi:glutamine synthetase
MTHSISAFVPFTAAAPARSLRAISSARSSLSGVPLRISARVPARVSIQCPSMSIIEDLKKLPACDSSCIAEYVWIDGCGGLRAKARTLKQPPSSVADLPDWNFDGSSTGQAPGEDSEVIIKARAIFPDPFRGAPHIIVMTDCYTPDGTPIPTNTRHEANRVLEKVKDDEPWFGLEQEYFMVDPSTGRPLGFPADGSDPPAQGPYYCGVGGSKLFGRDIVDAHYKACLYAGIKISGINAEVAPGQWEYQIGPATGIEQGDMLWMSKLCQFPVLTLVHALWPPAVLT